MTDYSELYAGKYFKSVDVEDEPKVLTIKSHSMENMQDGTRRAVVWFEGTDQGLVLNKTRWGALCTQAKSRKADDWIGQRIRISLGRVPFGGSMKPCMVLGPAEDAQAPVEPPAPEHPGKKLGEKLDDEIPF